MRSRALFALVSTILAAPAALAADLPGREGAIAPSPAFVQAATFSWTGFYAGLNAGYGWGKFNRAAGPLVGSGSGGLVGVQVGYNQQFGALVVGLEGDLNASWMSSRAAPAAGVLTKGSLDYFGTVRGRVGFAAERALIFVTGGYAGGEVKSSLVDANIPAAFSNSGWRHGFALGGGLEYAFTNNISAKAEYMYLNLGSQTIFGAPWLATSTYSASLVRAGVNYRF